jgi:hypothetical protein
MVKTDRHTRLLNRRRKIIDNAAWNGSKRRAGTAWLFWLADEATPHVAWQLGGQKNPGIFPTKQNKNSGALPAIAYYQGVRVPIAAGVVNKHARRRCFLASIFFPFVP